MMAHMDTFCPKVKYGKACNITGGVIFHGLPKGGKSLPKKISYTIRSGSRGKWGDMRKTEKQFPYDIKAGPRYEISHGE